MLTFQIFAPPAGLGDVLGLEDSSTFRTSTITCCLPRLPRYAEPDDCTKPGDFQKDTIRKSTRLS